MTASIDRVDPPSVVNHGGLEKVLTDDQVSLIVPSPLDRLYLIAMCYGTQSFACGHGALTLGERSCSLYNVTSVVIPEQSQDQIEAQTFTEDFLLDPTYRPNLPLLGHHRNEDPIVLSYGLPNLVVTPTLNQTLNAPIARRDIAWERFEDLTLASDISLLYVVRTKGGLKQFCKLDEVSSSVIPFTAQYWFFAYTPP